MFLVVVTDTDCTIKEKMSHNRHLKKEIGNAEEENGMDGSRTGENLTRRKAGMLVRNVTAVQDGNLGEASS